MRDTLVRTWADVAICARNIAREMQKRRMLANGVYGIPRGGVCLAVMFSHLLGIDYLDNPREGCLIVDDICDTGETLHFFEKYHPIFYTDVVKEKAIVMPQFFGLFVRKDLADYAKRVSFPWEMV